MLLLALELLVIWVVFLYSIVYCMCYKKLFYTVGLGNIASFNPTTKVTALLQIWAVLLSFEPYRVRALDNRKPALQFVLL